MSTFEEADHRTAVDPTPRSPAMQRRRLETPEPGGIALVGPTGSGKTGLLACLDRAFSSEEAREWGRFVAGGKLTDLLRRYSVENSRWGTYSFQIGWSAKESSTGKGELDEMEISVLDSPGEFFDSFSGPFSGPSHGDRNNMLQAVKTAECLVLCCPVIGARMNLVGLLHGLMSPASQRLRRLGAKPWPRQESPWERVERQELPFSRVLVTLTKIDLLCDAVVQQVAHAESSWRQSTPREVREAGSLRGLDSRQIAERLDIRRLFAERIDSVDLLKAALRPDASLAVCGVSTQLGDPQRPFGIWPALLYMATGRIVAPVVGAAGRAAHPVSTLEAMPKNGELP